MTTSEQLPLTLAIDPRISHLSYSGLLNLHACPRRYQLDRLNAEKTSIEDLNGSLTLAYGHAVGRGLQLILEGRSEEQTIFTLFLEWEVELFAENPKQSKSFWSAIQAVQAFKSMYESGLLEDWELVYYEGNPACELSFKIVLPDGFYFRGFVDAVLQHKVTGEVRVLECKTTAATNLNPAQYKNSSQAIGYSVVLDSLFPELSSYEVLYLVYTTKNFTWNPLVFTKSYLQRALWIQELLLDVEVIKLYEETGVYPMHGESCYNFYRECEYLQTCTLNTAYLTSPMTQAELEKFEEKESKYQIQVTIQDLITTQLRKSEVASTANSAPTVVNGDMML